MIALIFFIVLAATLLFLLLIWVSSRPPAPWKNLTGIQLVDLIESFHLSLPSVLMAARIFAVEDWDFVCQTGGKKLRELFLRERSSIALSWIRATQSQVSRVLRLYRLAARVSNQARFASEAKILLSYSAFHLSCGVLKFLIWFLGPFKARRTLDATLGLTEHLVRPTVDLLAGLESVRLNDIRRRWEQMPA